MTNPLYSSLQDPNLSGNILKGLGKAVPGSILRGGSRGMARSITEEERERERRRQRGEEVDEPGLEILDLDDVLLAIPRGIEGLVRSVGDLATLGTFELSESRSVLGRSDTIGGGILEGLAQFLLPFGAAGTALRVAGFGARTAGASRAAIAAGKAGRAGWTAAGGRLATGVTQGAIADFVAFSGSEARLSNLLQTFPALQNPVSEFLAADTDDPDVIGRFKNVLEGMGLSVLTDVIPAALQGHKAWKKALDEGASPEDAIKAGEAASPRGEDVDAALTELERQEFGGPDGPLEPGSGLQGADAGQTVEVFHAGGATTGPLQLDPNKPLFVGTERAASDRAGLRLQGQDTALHTFSLTPEKPYLPGGKILDERTDADALELLKIQSDPAVRQALRDQGHDVVPYINRTEDRGSVSYVVLDPQAVREVGSPRRGSVGQATETTEAGLRVGQVEFEPDPAAVPEVPADLGELAPGRFHGGAEELVVEEGHYSTKNVYGQGLYTTDDVGVASRYGKKRGGATHRVEEVGEITPFDLDGPIPDWMRESTDDLVQDALTEGIEGGPPRTVKDLYQNIRDLSQGEGVSADEVQELFDAFRSQMEQRGFNAIDVVGKRDKGVRIYFDPDSVKTTRVDPGDVATDVPGAAGRGTTPPDQPPTPGAEAGEVPAPVAAPSLKPLADMSWAEVRTEAKKHPNIKRGGKGATMKSLIFQIEEARLEPTQKAQARARLAGQAVDKNATKLQDAQGNPVPLNEDGTITLYHRTTQEQADAIETGGKLLASEPGQTTREGKLGTVTGATRTDASFFSTKATGEISGYGGPEGRVVEVRVDPTKVEVSDVFADEVFVKVTNEDLESVTVPRLGPIPSLDPTQGGGQPGVLTRAGLDQPQLRTEGQRLNLEIVRKKKEAAYRTGQRVKDRLLISGAQARKTGGRLPSRAATFIRQLQEHLAAGKDPRALLRSKMGLSAAQIQVGIAQAETIVQEFRGEGHIMLARLLSGTTPEVRAAMGLHARGDLNLAYWDAPEDELAMVRAFEKMADINKLDPTTEAELLMEAAPLFGDLNSQSNEELTATMLRFKGDGLGFIERVIGVRMAFRGATNRLMETVKNVNVETAEGASQLQLALERFVILGEAAVENSSIWGRAGRANQIIASADIVDTLGRVRDIQADGQIKNLLGDAEFKRRITQLQELALFDGVALDIAANRWAKMNGLQRVGAITVEVFVSNLLSSFRTLVTNGIFPLMTSFYLPMENMFGGALASAVGVQGGAELVQKSFDQIVGNVVAMSEAAHFGKRAYSEGPIITRKGRDVTEFISRSMVRSSVMGIEKGSLAFGIDAFGQFLSFPGRVMTSTDEFVKQFTARGYLYAEFLAKARKEGIVDQGLRAEFVAEHMDRAFVEGQIVTEEFITKEATRRALDSGVEFGTPEFEAARRAVYDDLMDNATFEEINQVSGAALKVSGEATATSELEKGTVGRTVKDFTNAHPVTRLVAPFTQTPINLAKFAGQRLDVVPVMLNFLGRRSTGDLDLVALEASRSRNLKAMMSGDREEQLKVASRWMAGISMTSAAVVAAHAGFMTGRGPEDPEQRKLLLQTGWLPYAFKTDEGYIQYMRADPFATFLGISADLVDIARMAREDEQSHIEAAMQGIMGSLSGNILNKTYASGVRAFLDALMDPGRRGAQFARGMVSGLLIPRSVQSLVIVTDDPVMRDVNTIVEAVFSRTPFLSSSIPVERDVLGDPIRRVTALAPGGEGDSAANLWTDMLIPVAYRSVKDDVISQEFRDLREGFSPPPMKRFGIRLSDYRNDDGDDPRDEWGRLHGKVRLEGRTLKRQLREVIRSREYQALPGQGGSFERSPKARALGRVISDYREEAWEQMLRKFPGLRARVAGAQRDRELVRSGDLGAIRSLSNRIQTLGE